MTSGVATATITVKSVNDAPVARTASYYVQKDGSIRIDLGDLVSDVDDGCLDIWTCDPLKGTLKRGYTGVDAFTYTVMLDTGAVQYVLVNLPQGASR